MPLTPPYGPRPPAARPSGVQGRQELPLWAVLVVAAGVLALGLKGTSRGPALDGSGESLHGLTTGLAQLEGNASDRAKAAGQGSGAKGFGDGSWSDAASAGLLVPVKLTGDRNAAQFTGVAGDAAEGTESSEDSSGPDGRGPKALLVQSGTGDGSDADADSARDGWEELLSDDRSEDAVWRGLREEGSYRDGVRDGAWRAWRSDGSLRWVGNYREGLRDGLWETYGLLGHLETELQYEAGSRHGDWRAYGESGALVEEGQYDQNHASGRWTVYYSSGQVKERGRYVHGLREGVWEFYDDLGVPTLQAGEYRAGIKIQ